MKKIEKEQVLFAMLKGIEHEQAYQKWFGIALKEFFKDPIVQSEWNERLITSLTINAKRRIATIDVDAWINSLDVDS